MRPRASEATTPLSQTLPHMRVKSLFLAASAGLLTVACASTPGQHDNHWNIGGLGPRLAYHGLGYQPYMADSYRDHQWQQKQDINLTLRRHFLNNNPENPFQPEDKSLSDPRGPHSILPDPVNYLHLEALMFGLVFTASGGTFIPVPVGSLLGTIEEGGFEEFGEGIKQTVSGDWDSEGDGPPTPKEFRVKNTRI